MADAAQKDSVATRFAYVAVVAPAILTLAALALQFRWLPETPDPIAVHWSGTAADGSGPGWTYPLITVLMGFGLSAWLWAAALPRLRRGARGWSFRFLAATALGLSAFCAIAMTWAVAMQRGLESWHDAPSVLPSIIVGALLGIGAGAIGWFAQPAQTVTFERLPAARVDLADSQRAVWVGVARSGRGLVAVLIGAVSLLAVAAFVTWFAGNFAAMWILAGVAVLLAILLLTSAEADVRVDATGIEVRGPAGVPRSSIAIGDVASASAITVEALGSFGGWGWRRVPGAMGVILRSGEALKVERKEGHALVVTVDDAATAAALLTALTARARA